MLVLGPIYYYPLTDSVLFSMSSKMSRKSLVNRTGEVRRSQPPPNLTMVPPPADHPRPVDDKSSSGLERFTVELVGLERMYNDRRRG